MRWRDHGANERKEIDAAVRGLRNNTRIKAAAALTTSIVPDVDENFPISDNFNNKFNHIKA